MDNKRKHKKKRIEGLSGGFEACRREPVRLGGGKSEKIELVSEAEKGNLLVIDEGEIVVNKIMISIKTKSFQIPCGVCFELFGAKSM